jgi:short-subunit dehydrogenase
LKFADLFVNQMSECFYSFPMADISTKAPSSSPVFQTPKDSNMDDFKNRYGSWAIVAGAGEGIGAAYCQALGELGINLLMIDHNEQAMQATAKKVASAHSIETMQLVLDLGSSDATLKVMEAIEDLDCRLLIYNAAYGPVKPFLVNDTSELDKYIDINCRSTLHLVHAFAGYLKTGVSGGIILMASLASLWGTQLVAPYAATKAFNLILAEALYYELKPFGIDVLACVAGATATPGYLSSNPRYGRLKPKVMKPEDVAAPALRNLGRRPLFFPGFTNRFTYFIFTRLLTRRASARIFNNVMRKMYA